MVSYNIHSIRLVSPCVKVSFLRRFFHISTEREAVSQIVIPAKSRKAGREPGSRKNHTIIDLAGFQISPAVGGLVRNDGFGEL